MNRARFEELLEASVSVHGHLCPGQVLGVRMAMVGLDAVGILDPRGKDRKKIYLFVEIDRCATDALQSVTGCSSGHRTMKLMDYGKMAATFVNLATHAAVRVVAREDAREKARHYFPEIDDKYRCQLEAYKIMPDGDLFTLTPVEVHIPPQDMPGRPLSRVSCSACGEVVQDRREVRADGAPPLCQPCASGGYYVVRPLFSDGVMHNGHNPRP